MEDILELLKSIPIESGEKVLVNEVPNFPAVVDHHGSCINCAANDWIPDVERGDLVCRVCGLCQDPIRRHGLTYNEKHARFVGGRAGPDDERMEQVEDGETMVSRKSRKRREWNVLEHLEPLSNAEHNNRLRKIARGEDWGASRSAPYKRITYFRERLSQWAMQEPPIPEHDWDIICEEYRGWCTDESTRCLIPSGEELRTTGGRVRGTIFLTKEEIRAILVRCDAPHPGRVTRGAIVNDLEYTWLEQNDDPEAPGYVKRGHFVKKYYEKWITIRYRFSGVGSMADTIPHWVLTEMCIAFTELQPAFWKVVYDPNERKSLISYNWIFARLLDMYGQPHAAVDFPGLKTDSKRRKLDEYWRRICAFMRWPYINSSDENLKPKTKRRK